MNDKQIIEDIIKSIAASFTGEQSTRDWTEETKWFDASPVALVGKEKAAKIFDSAFGNLKSCDVTILNMKTRINGDSALVCTAQKWDTVNKDGSANPPFTGRSCEL